MKTMTTQKQLMGWLAAVALTMGLAACGDKTDEVENPQQPPQEQPQPQTPTGEKYTVPQDGGTVQTESLKMDIPGETFAGEADVYVDHATSEELVGDVAYSSFYKVSLPESMNKEIELTIKGEFHEDAHMVVCVDGWNRETNEQTTLVHPLPTTYANGTYSAKLPQMQGEAGIRPELVVGLVDSPEDQGEQPAETKATVSGARFTINWYYHWSLEDRKIVNLTREYAQQAVDIIESLGFRLPEGVVIPIVFRDKVDGWGSCYTSGWGKRFYEVQLNEKSFKNLLTESEDRINQMKQTVVHEMLHYYTGYAYDPRYAYNIAAQGAKGDYWTLLEEAAAGWIEKYAGNKMMYEGVVANGMEFMQNFYPNEINYSTSIAHGYGMGLVIEYWAKRHGDKSILRLFELKRDGKAASLWECFDLYLAEFNDKLFDFWEFGDFINAVKDYQVDSRFGLPGMSETSSLRLTEDAPIVSKAKVKKWGVWVKGIYIPQAMPQGDVNVPYNIPASRQLTIQQTNKGLVTDVYEVDAEHPGGVLIGSSRDASVVTITSDLKRFQANGVLFTLTRSWSNAALEEESEIIVTLADPEPTLSIDKLELSFEGKGGEQKVGAKSNISSIRMSTTAAWLDATYENGFITVKAAQNTTGEEREAYVIARVQNGTGNLEETIHVTQAAMSQEEINASMWEGVTFDNFKLYFTPYYREPDPGSPSGVTNVPANEIRMDQASGVSISDVGQFISISYEEHKDNGLGTTYDYFVYGRIDKEKNVLSLTAEYKYKYDREFDISVSGKPGRIKNLHTRSASCSVDSIRLYRMHFNGDTSRDWKPGDLTLFWYDNDRRNYLKSYNGHSETHSWTYDKDNNVVDERHDVDDYPDEIIRMFDIRFFLHEASYTPPASSRRR